MKNWFLFLLLSVALGANAQQKQSLKDLLYSGKLKMDSNSVVRKGDDLSSRIDTSTKKAVEPAEPKKPDTAIATDSASNNATSTPANTAESMPAADASSQTVAAPTEVAAPAKSNNKIWKEYTESLISTLKAEVLPSKKIKKDTYYLIAEYEIGTDGSVNVLNVVSTPENSFLQEQVKERLTAEAPKLAPVVDSNNKPKKVKRKQSFSITKD